MAVLSMPAAPTTQPPLPYRTIWDELDGITAITRLWRPGDAPRCRLCDRCSAHDDVCLVMTDAHVGSIEAARHFDSRPLGPPMDDPRPARTWRDYPPERATEAI